MFISILTVFLLLFVFLNIYLFHPRIGSDDCIEELNFIPLIQPKGDSKLTLKVQGEILRGKDYPYKLINKITGRKMIIEIYIYYPILKILFTSRKNLDETMLRLRHFEYNVEVPEGVDFVQYEDSCKYFWFRNPEKHEKVFEFQEIENLKLRTTPEKRGTYYSELSGKIKNPNFSFTHFEIFHENDELRLKAYGLPTKFSQENGCGALNYFDERFVIGSDVLKVTFGNKKNVIWPPR